MSTILDMNEDQCILLMLSRDMLVWIVIYMVVHWKKDVVKTIMLYRVPRRAKEERRVQKTILWHLLGTSNHSRFICIRYR